MLASSDSVPELAGQEPPPAAQYSPLLGSKIKSICDLLHLSISLF